MSMLRNLATSLINSRNERIITTLPKAKELRPFVEKVITLSRHAQHAEGENAAAKIVHLRRQAATFFHAGNREQAPSSGKRGQTRAPRTAGVAAVKRLFSELGDRFKDRPGGYTRILKLGRRDGDNAELAIIELVGNPRERQAADSTAKAAKSVTSGKKSTTKASQSSAVEGGRRGGKKADRTYEKSETTEARGRGEVEEGGGEAQEGESSERGRRAKKTESTADEKKSE